MANTKNTLEYFIPISRKLFEHRFWCEEREFSRFEAWIYLLKEARFEDTKLYDGNKVVNIQRGQIYVSIRFLANKFQWSKKKVCGFLDLLVSDEMIIKETAKETGQTVLTICNYDKYNVVNNKRRQDERHKGDSKGTISNIDINKDSNIYPPIVPPGEVEVKNWRDDFNVYLSDLEISYNELVNDKEFIAERQRYHPNLNIRLSMEKAYKDYWSTEGGWERRKKSKSITLNWKSTFKDALTRNMNQVYLTENEKREKNKPDTIFV